MILLKMDKDRELIIGFGALKYFREVYKKPFMNIEKKELQEKFDDIIPLIFFAGLKHEDPELTLEKTIELMDRYYGIKKIMRDIMPLVFKELGEEDEDEEEEATERKN